MTKVSKVKADLSPTALVKSLWADGFFSIVVPLKKVCDHFSLQGINLPIDSWRMALKRADFLILKKENGIIGYIQKRPAISKEVDKVQVELFDSILMKKLEKNFKTEFEDLHLNFGKSGNCTAFLLRKILEKLIYIVMTKNSLGSKIEDKNKPGTLLGLESMINIASAHKIGEFSVLTPKTAEEIKGMKFLGDTAAHNPLVDVDMKTIIPQMPYIITAYKELALHL